MSAIVYDAAVLVAADRNERRAWAEHKVRLELGIVPLVPAPVVAQVSRSPQQAQLRRFLTGCVVVAFGESDAHEAGRLLGKTETSDVVDAVVVTTDCSAQSYDSHKRSARHRTAGQGFRQPSRSRCNLMSKDEMQRQIEEFVSSLNTEFSHRGRPAAVESNNSLIPVIVIKRPRKSGA